MLTRLTVIGAIYLSVLFGHPQILIAHFSVPFYFGGTSLLIVVTVMMDTISQIQLHLLAHQYEGLIKACQAAWPPPLVDWICLSQGTRPRTRRRIRSPNSTKLILLVVRGF